MHRLRISNDLFLSSGNLDPGTLNAIRGRFTFDNPKFSENLRLGFSVWNTPEKIRLYHETGAGISFPRGLVRELLNTLPEITFEDHTVTVPVDLPDSKIKLRPYQQKAVQAMLERNQGELVAPPGAGKTVTGIDTVLKRKQKTLILCHTKDLLGQWKDRFQAFTGIKTGTIDDSGIDIRDITVGMVQSVNAKRMPESFYKGFGCLILDECHHCPANTFQRLVSRFHARFRYGLTATPERRDGLTFILHAVFGPVLHEVSRDDLFQAGQVIRPVINKVETGFYMPVCEDYRALIDGVTGDGDRNALIMRHLIKEAEAGHSCLVLSERISHIEDLSLIFRTQVSDIRSAVLTSRVSKADRKMILEEAAEGKIKVIFATKLADEGLDLPILSRLFLTCPVRSASKVTQQTGRIMRPFQGKADAQVYDFTDSLIDLARSQWHTRRREAYSDFEIREIGNAN